MTKDAINDPENYARCCQPRTLLEVRDVSKAFLEEVYELRNRYGIADMSIAFEALVIETDEDGETVHTETGEPKSYRASGGCHYGSSDRRLPVAAYMYGYAKRLNELAMERYEQRGATSVDMQVGKEEK